MTMAISMAPGDTAYISIPIITEEGSFPNGAMPAQDTFTFMGREVTPLVGFVVEDETIGKISKVSQSDKVIAGDEPLTIKYEHFSLEANKIYFFSADYESTYVSIVSVPIHDHTSIFTGGPAHGTYDSEYEAP